MGSLILRPFASYLIRRVWHAAADSDVLRASWHGYLSRSTLTERSSERTRLIILYDFLGIIAHVLGATRNGAAWIPHDVRADLSDRLDMISRIDRPSTWRPSIGQRKEREQP